MPVRPSPPRQEEEIHRIAQLWGGKGLRKEFESARYSYLSCQLSRELTEDQPPPVMENYINHMYI